MEMVDIRSLKKMIRRDYPEDAPIRKVILSEPDEMPKYEYAIKLTVWFKLIPVKKGS
jgi:hypothetical protein